MQHSYPHCWRHKTPIIFRATPQWFISMDKRIRDYRSRTKETEPCAKPRLAAVEATAFYPSWGRARLEAMIKNRPDWCVSRQRNWGVPMASVCKQANPRTSPAYRGVVGAGGTARRTERESKHGSAWNRRSYWATRRKITETSRYARRLVRFRHHARHGARNAAPNSGIPRIFIWRALTSTGAGFNPRC